MIFLILATDWKKQCSALSREQAQSLVSAHHGKQSRLWRTTLLWLLHASNVLCHKPVAMLGLLVKLLLMRVSLPLTLGLATIVFSITVGTLCPILQQQNCTQTTQL